MLPDDRVGTQRPQDILVRDESRLRHIRQYGTPRIGHQPQPLQPPASLLVQLRPGTARTAGTQPLHRRSRRELFHRAVNPAETQRLLHGIHIPECAVIDRPTPPDRHPALLLPPMILRQPCPKLPPGLRIQQIPYLHRPNALRFPSPKVRIYSWDRKNAVPKSGKREAFML